MEHRELLVAIATYCAARHEPFWVMHNPPHQTLGGVSARLVGIADTECVLQNAADGLHTVPMDEVEVPGFR